MDLHLLGWNDHWESLFAPHREAGLQAGRVVGEDKHYYRVVTTDGESLAQIAGRLHRPGQDPASLPKVGDWVAVETAAHGDRTRIPAVLPRRTFLARKVSGRTASVQVLATNIDVVFVVQACDATFNARRLERFLVMVHEGGARPVVVLNKVDVADDPDRFLAAARAVAGSVEIVGTSARTGRALPRLREFIPPGQTAAFLGTSGVGKSSLINRLCRERLQPTLPVREDDSKGRHSTTWREILPLPDGGLVIDTPGLREFHLWEAGEGMEEAFPEVAELAAGCRFRDCRHQAEPGCAVREAASTGRLAAGRWASFQKLQQELATLRQAREEQEQKRPTRPRSKSSRSPRADGPGDDDFADAP